MSKFIEEVSSVRNFVSRMAAYEDLFERTRDAVILLDIDMFSVLDLNSAGLQILGEAKDEMVGRAITDWVEGAQLEKFKALLTESKDAYYGKNKIFLWKSRQGRSLAMDVTVCSLKLSNGTKIIQLIARDISAEVELRKRSEKYLKDLQETKTKLEIVSERDELTGLSNFKHFQKFLHAEHARAQNDGLFYSIVFLDIDNFKAYNDRNGLNAGDEVLKEMGKIIRKNCKDQFYPTRCGGEEFAILCVGTAKNAALNFATQLKMSVEIHPFRFRETQPLGRLSVSVGVASFPDDATEAGRILNAADNAANESKRNGRNRVTAAIKKAA